MQAESDPSLNLVTAPSSLLELLEIPSVSADPEQSEAVRAALDWVAEFILDANGEAALVDGESGGLVVGEIQASSAPDRAPTVICYGHVDVQPPDPLDLWESPPFEPTVRDGWLYCRGVADDKGQFWILLETARRLSAAGELPVNVRFLCDAEEEVGGRSAARWIESDRRGADACVIFDTAMLRGRIPVFNIACRGTAYFHVVVRTGTRDVHSGVYGGAGLNALHVLVNALGAVVARDGRLPEELRSDVDPVPRDEVVGWRDLPAGAEVMAAQGVAPADDAAAEEFYLRTWVEPSLDVHGIEGGSPHLQKTVLPARAEANLSIRLVPGQTVAGVTRALEKMLADATPTGASLQLRLLSASEPALVRPDSPAIQLGRLAFERILGVRPHLVRTGGSLPLAPALARRRIGAVISGFDVPEGNIHAPNERFLLENLELGLAVARELYVAYEGLR